MNFIIESFNRIPTLNIALGSFYRPQTNHIHFKIFYDWFCNRRTSKDHESRKKLKFQSENRDDMMLDILFQQESQPTQDTKKFIRQHVHKPQTEFEETYRKAYLATAARKRRQKQNSNIKKSNEALPTTLDLLRDNCSTHGSSHFCDVSTQVDFQCENKKCMLSWHRNCMKDIALENDIDVEEFDSHSSHICINCFINSKKF